MSAGRSERNQSCLTAVGKRAYDHNHIRSPSEVKLVHALRLSFIYSPSSQDVKLGLVLNPEQIQILNSVKNLFCLKEKKQNYYFRRCEDLQA